MTKQFNRLTDDKNKKSAVWHEFKIVEQYPLHKIKAIIGMNLKLSSNILCIKSKRLSRAVKNLKLQFPSKF